jgi:hypothetical protein
MGCARRRALQAGDCCRCHRRGDVTTRAAVRARTCATPAALSTRAHASNVAPVVHTSSTSTTISPWSRRAARVGANAFRTF